MFSIKIVTHGTYIWTDDPPYLPPVGELDDVANFSGGASRTRDEILLDLSNDCALSPSRLVKNPVVTNICSRASNRENVPPQTRSGGKEKQKQAIFEAAAASIKEDVQEVEDIEWQGPAYARDLPFVGFTFTPGMLMGETRAHTNAASTAAATNMIMYVNNGVWLLAQCVSQNIELNLSQFCLLYFVNRICLFLSSQIPGAFSVLMRELNTHFLAKLLTNRHSTKESDI